MITLDTRTELILTIKIYDSSFIGNTEFQLESRP